VERASGRPKLTRRLIRQFVAGAAIEPDDDLRDAILLHAHPGWSWRELQETPAQVVEHVRAIDYELAKKRER